jgi:hypothetical protein
MESRKMHANQISSPDADSEVIRLEKLNANYRSRITELVALQAKLAMADTAANLVSRAEALAGGGAYEPVRSAVEIDDEISVLRGAAARVSEQTIDARAMAVIRITRDTKLHERAAETRAQVAAACAALLAAIDAARELSDTMDAADISPTGPRWTGCPAPGVPEAVAGLALECGEGLDAEAVHALRLKAGIFVEPVFSEAARPAPVIVKSLRRKVAEAIGELMA